MYASQLFSLIGFTFLISNFLFLTRHGGTYRIYLPARTWLTFYLFSFKVSFSPDHVNERSKVFYGFPDLYRPDPQRVTATQLLQIYVISLLEWSWVLSTVNYGLTLWVWNCIRQYSYYNKAIDEKWLHIWTAVQNQEYKAWCNALSSCRKFNNIRTYCNVSKFSYHVWFAFIV